MIIKLTDREKDVILSALHKRVDSSKDMQIAALLDKENLLFQPEAPDLFAELTHEAERLLIKVRDHTNDPLIDAAPAMLEALKQLDEFFDDAPTLRKIARDAIAKAQVAE